ncbi:PTS sugar transporter subunit IIA [Collinsella sp. An2]|uniref:PTS sugar transporter subunit IIA n=1 Tax=Collinsella sp. An2 TaxID=1965585 RepID=UPI000B37AC34|nr:PTS sugar transporter subunit IIA [Collinsella sp. An2]OUP07287.1 transcriptional regulator [Collinsella sp. An2]
MQFSEMLKPENVRIVQSVDTWEDAIRLAVKPLEEGGYVEPCYADNIIEATKKMGPYYVLTEDVALIHGRPEDGVLKQQFAVTLLREPIKFSEDSFEVRLLVTLAAEDANSHIDAMRVLASIFCDADKIAQIVSLDTAQEVYDAFVEAAAE